MALRDARPERRLTAVALTEKRAPRAGALLMALAFVAMFASAPGQSFFISVFVDEILADTGLSRTAFSALYGIATVASAAWVLAAGRLADRFGLRAVWIVGVAGLATACGLVSVATGVVALLLALAMLRAFGQGTFPLVGTLLVAQSFGDRRGRAMAVASYGLVLAGALLPPALAVLIIEVGWRPAYQLVAVALVAAILPFALAVRGRPPASVDAAAALERPPRRPPRPGLRTLLFILAAPPLVTTAVTFHAVSLFAERGVSLTGTALALTVLAVGGGVATAASGALADRASTRALLFVLSASVAAGMLALAGGSAPGGYIAFALLGVAGGVYAVANGVVFARAYGTTGLGGVQGVAASTQIAGAAIGPVPLAVAYSLFDGYAPAIVGFLGLAVLCCVLAARWRPPAPPAAAAAA